jgi:ABC-type spermidine/putrescine transport system permease subunit II
MKAIGFIAMLAGAAFFTIYLGIWISILTEHGMAEAARQSFANRYTILAQVVLLVPAIIFGVGGLLLLSDKK